MQWHAFERYIGIDYSGAETPDSSLKGLRLYLAAGGEPPAEIQPPPSPRKYWTRRGLAHWLAAEIAAGPPALIGIDHAFSFPIQYFDKYGLEHDWGRFLDDFASHWPTADAFTFVDFVRQAIGGGGSTRCGDARWRRLTEVRSGAKSVFHFDVPGSVAKSTHAGLPWLRHLRLCLRDRIHFWPYDGWRPTHDRTVIAEVYPSLWSRDYPSEGRTPDQHDAYSAARWLSHADRTGAIEAFFAPPPGDDALAIASIEGWILGVPAT